MKTETRLKLNDRLLVTPFNDGYADNRRLSIAERLLGNT